MLADKEDCSSRAQRRLGAGALITGRVRQEPQPLVRSAGPDSRIKASHRLGHKRQVKCDTRKGSKEGAGVVPQDDDDLGAKQPDRPEERNADGRNAHPTDRQSLYSSGGLAILVLFQTANRRRARERPHHSKVQS